MLLDHWMVAGRLKEPDPFHFFDGVGNESSELICSRARCNIHLYCPLFLLRRRFLCLHLSINAAPHLLHHLHFLRCCYQWAITHPMSSSINTVLLAKKNPDTPFGFFSYLDLFGHFEVSFCLEDCHCWYLLVGQFGQIPPLYRLVLRPCQQA